MNLFLYLLLALFSIVSCQLSDIDRLRHDISRFLSVSRYNETEKAVTRRALRQAFDGMGLGSMTQSFANEDTNEIGSNVISIQQGPFYGTSEDRIVVLTANYDTLEDNPGVDDNGSGVAALLETARIMATIEHIYKRQYTIIYAIVDMKHKPLGYEPVDVFSAPLFYVREKRNRVKQVSLMGSHSFVEELLLPMIQSSNATISGVIVLDGVLHFDPFPSTQAVPEGFEEVFPGAAKELQEHNHMGDFIQVIGRSLEDDVIVQKFVSSFVRASSMLINDWSFRPWLLPLRLPMHEVSSIDSLYRLHSYLFADHSSFYFHSNQNIDIPTVYVTDTLKMRGVRQYCSYCDGLYMLTDQNMKFLSLITDSIVRALILLSGSEAGAIIDELHQFSFRIAK